MTAAFLDLLVELTDFLHRDGVTVDDIVARVGRVTEDEGKPLPVRLAPSLPGVTAASIGRDADGAPYELTIVPAIEARPTLGALAARFGSYQRVPSDRGRPRRVELTAATAPPLRVAILADLAPDADVVDSAQVVKLHLLRERSASTAP